MRRFELLPFVDYSNILTIISTLKALGIIAVLFDITPGTFLKPCNGSWPLDMPVACTKKLWRAETEADWNLEYTRYLTVWGGPITPNYHDLLMLEYGKVSTMQKKPLEEWVKELDEFGMMSITITKHFPETRLLYSGYGVPD
jgi:hypothetical protein